MSACVVAPGSLAGKECEVQEDCPPELECVREASGGAGLCLTKGSGSGSIAGPEGADGNSEQHAGAAGGPGSSQGSAPDGGGPTSPGGGGPYYCDQIKPILDTYCSGCHGSPPAGGAPATFRLDVFGSVGNLLGAGAKAARIKARAVDTQTMPPAASPQPTAEERALLAAWAQAGAPECADSDVSGLPDGGSGNSVGYVDGPVSFSAHVKPILQTYCASCHTGGDAPGDFSVTTSNVYAQLMAESDEESEYVRVQPGDVGDSLIWIAMTAADSELVDAMPYGSPGLAVLAPEDFKVVELWIQQGAPNN